MRVRATCTAPEGWVDNSDDCDDTNPRCTADCTDLDGDGACADQDCDESDDTGADCATQCQSFYRDADGDGLGLEGAARLACALPDGHSVTPGDCDDTNVHCGADCTDADADLYCADRDCDDSAQTGATCFDGCVTHYADADGDGLGDPASAATACVLPPERQLDAGDCDDSLPLCGETCVDFDNDGACGEHDCDDSPRTGSDCFEGCTPWYQDFDNDGAGQPSSFPFIACSEPWGYTDNDRDCNDFRPRCIEDCTDLDGDLRCGVFDCDDSAETGADCHDGCVEFFLDTDGDGFGVNTGTISACSLPPGFADNTDDCDDENPTCGSDCTDGDADQRCVGGDCADDDANAWVSCASCTDSDGDGWWRGCDAYADVPGPDCAPDDAGRQDDCVGDGRFTLATTLDVGLSASGIIAADFNLDGRMDLAVGQVQPEDSVYVLLGQGSGREGSGTFSVEAPLSGLGADPNALAAGDLDGDGYPELVVLSRSSRRVTVLRRRPAGGFDEAQSFSLTTFANGSAVRLADYNGDGHLDLLISQSAAKIMHRALGNGDGTFTDLPPLEIDDGHPGDFQLAELTGDAHLDFVLARSDANFCPCHATRIEVFAGDGAGGFTPHRTLSARFSRISSIALGDISGDGHEDLVVADRDADEIHIYTARLSGGQPTGEFRSDGDEFAFEPSEVQIADLDGDGLLDIANSNSQGQRIVLHRGLGYNSTFRYWDFDSPWPAVLTEDAPSGFVLTDLTADRVADIAVAFGFGGEIQIFRGDRADP